MIEFLCFLTGFLLGGFVETALLCCFQINRINKYEAEIQKIKEEKAELTKQKG